MNLRYNPQTKTLTINNLIQVSTVVEKTTKRLIELLSKKTDQELSQDFTEYSNSISMEYMSLSNQASRCANIMSNITERKQYVVSYTMLTVLGA